LYRYDVAGTSCVDYSNLNNEKKGLDAQGESGQTFRGMMTWIEKNDPPIIILENVCNAPWEQIAQRFRDKGRVAHTPGGLHGPIGCRQLNCVLTAKYRGEKWYPTLEKGYQSHFMRVDTKRYYIPHTRTRVYLFAAKTTQGIDITSLWWGCTSGIQLTLVLESAWFPALDLNISSEKLVSKSAFKCNSCRYTLEGKSSSSAPPPPPSRRSSSTATTRACTRWGRTS
jgi:site-specific DNA-cytosine methylase